MHEMEKGLEQQEFCACGDHNVESVILMSEGLFLLLHFAFHFPSLTIFYPF